MAVVKVYNLAGKEIEELNVSDSVFSLPKNDDLVHQVAVAMDANKRQVLADTKTRGERAGSGIKPWKQKGTGRARVGSRRTPLWKKGGVVFGPSSDRNFKQKINKKMNQKAIATVLSGKLKDNEIFVIDKLAFSEKKTKHAVSMLENLKIKGKTLMAFSDQEKEFRLMSRNLVKVENILTGQLNVLAMLKNKNLVMSKESVQYLEKKYTQAE
ncbi:MAG TPA: 50S ribosomal protein L4 [Candidatus Moranbacteria bacterium]|nr:50S ribosomal protein L4 [Candidatus Moranbacteria bacterium]HAT74755.1 50S ribosomal protein L4 [Candidatus Moranbacteria bacterium]